MTEAAERIHFHEVEVMNYPLFDHPPYTLALATKMHDVAVGEKLDLLHVHYAVPHSVSAYLARAMLEPRRLPFVTTLHGTDITLVGNDRSYLPITRFSIENSDAVTAVSDYLRNVTLDQFEIQCPVKVIPNFVNCDLFHPGGGAFPSVESERRSLAPDEHKILMHLSNFRPVKRITDVVEIFDRVQAKLPSTLVFVGDGPDRSAAEWLVRQKGLTSKVRFLGKQCKKLEPEIDDLLGRKLVNPDFLHLLVEHYNKSLGEAAFAPDALAIAGKLKQLREKKERVLEAFFEGMIDRAERDRRVQDVERELSVYQQLLLASGRTERQPALDLDVVSAIVQPFVEWEFLGREDRRALLAALCPEISVYRYEIKGISLNLAAPAGDGDKDSHMRMAR